MNFRGLFVESYRPRRHAEASTLKAYLTVRIPSLGIDVRGVAHHLDSNGSGWIELPYRLRRKPDGTELRIYTIRFINALDWRTFHQDVLDAIESHAKYSASA